MSTVCTYYVPLTLTTKVRRSRTAWEFVAALLLALLRMQPFFSIFIFPALDLVTEEAYAFLALSRHFIAIIPYTTIINGHGVYGEV